MTKAQSDVPRVWLDAFALLTAGFLVLAYCVSQGYTQQLDESLLLSLRTEGNPNDPIGSGFVEELVRDITALAGTAILTVATILIAIFLMLQRKLALAAMTIIAIGGASIVSGSLKHLFDRDRPAMVAHGMEVFNQSFPSGHATQAAATYLFLAFLIGSQMANLAIKRFAVAAAITLFAMIGVSRVYLGVHWPSDVLAGWLVGSAWAVLLWYITQKLIAIKP
ncbi:phosphatase PAP2 family protein [Halioxenophilus aromaticivorans]